MTDVLSCIFFYPSFMPFTAFALCLTFFTVMLKKEAIAKGMGD